MEMTYRGKTSRVPAVGIEQADILSFKGDVNVQVCLSTSQPSTLFRTSSIGNEHNTDPPGFFLMQQKTPSVFTNGVLK